MIRSLLLLSLVLTGCQSNPSKDPSQDMTENHVAVERQPSTSSVLLRTFIRELASHSGHSAAAIDRAAVTYIQKAGKEAGHGNWNELGLTQEEAMKISSIYDDLPHMNKVRKWVQNNVTRIMNVDRRAAELAYEAMMKGRQYHLNPYSAEAAAISQRVAGARDRFKPVFETINLSQHRVNMAITNLGSKAKNLTASAKKSLTELKNRYKEALLTYIRRGKVSPAIAANGNEIVESAVLITEKTGLPAMGAGCKSFSEGADVTTIARKADVDLERAQIVEDRAVQKAGQEFTTYDQIPADKRLTAQELDDATKDAFKVVNGLTDDEARTVVQRLKQQPCSLY